MSAIVIPHAVRRDVVAYLRDYLPYEGCGLLIGGGRVVDSIRGIPNVADEAHQRYVMDGERLAPALSAIERRGEAWLGVFHAHVGCEPVPSQIDIEDARLQTAGMVHLIVSFMGDEVRLGAWRIDADGGVERIAIEATERASADVDDGTPLSRYERRLLVVVGLVTVILLVMVALTLLPPPPELN